MSGARHSKSYYNDIRYGKQKARRKNAKARKRMKKAHRERDRRAERIDAEYGAEGTSSCSRKIRYPNIGEAQKYIATHASDKRLYCYRCRYCGGWHLTSHPRDGDHTTQHIVLGKSKRHVKPQDMVFSSVQTTTHGEVPPLTVRDVLESAREAALEIRRIEEQAEIRRAAIGVQGHTYGVHSKSGILDPSRKVIDLIEWEDGMVNTSELQDPIVEASEVVDGIDAMGDPGVTEAVSRYYLEAQSWNEVARAMEDRVEHLRGLPRKTQVKCLIDLLDECFVEWESIGIAKLKEMGRG